MIFTEKLYSFQLNDKQEKKKKNKIGQKQLEKNNMLVEKQPLSLSELESMQSSCVMSSNKDWGLSHCSKCKIYLARADMDQG